VRPGAQRAARGAPARVLKGARPAQPRSNLFRALHNHRPTLLTRPLSAVYIHEYLSVMYNLQIPRRWGSWVRRWKI
jgi:hypothetical protein